MIIHIILAASIVTPKLRDCVTWYNTTKSQLVYKGQPFNYFQSPNELGFEGRGRIGTSHPWRIIFTPHTPKESPLYEIKPLGQCQYKKDVFKVYYLNPTNLA